jgi:sugar lactone lactonase YvrE
MLAFLGFAFIPPATVAAQPLVYLTQWGSLGSGDGQFREPAGVATDAAGDVYVADAANARIQKFTGTGTYLTQWGSSGYGDGQFVYPIDVATNGNGDVYVADAAHRIQKFSATGTYLTQWGGYGSGNGQFNGPTGVATDANGNVYVADYFNNRIQKFTGTGTYVTQWGSQGSGDGQFNDPREVTTDAAGSVYVVDQLNHRIQKFTGTGTYVTQWGSFGNGDGQFNAPNGVEVDAAGNVYVADTFNHRIQKFTGTGTYLTQWGSQGSGNGEFLAPVGMATDAAGNLYVADNGNHRIQKFGPAPTPAITIAFDLKPNTLNLASQGQWVTGFLEPPSPSAASDIDIASIRLNGTVPVDPATPTALGDQDGNGVPDLMVKFSRSALELNVSQGESVPVVVTGTIGSDSFVGTDHIRVIRAVVSAPVAGSHLAGGSVTEVRWQMPSGIAIPSVGLLYSLDGGGTWNLIARGQPNRGSYDWTLPNVQTDQAKVVVVEPSDQTGSIADGVLAVSEAFSIDALVDVNDHGPAQLALRGITPNPAQNELHVSFSLSDSRAATLALFDVSGRQLSTRRVDGLGAGWHTVELGGRSSLPAGLYVIRLTQGGRSLTTRAAVVR